MEKNIEHMKDIHSFDLPYSEGLKDTAAVLRYLAEKIHIGNICIGCNNLHTGAFKNSQAVQQHMQDKGHTYLDLSIFQEEYANFVKHRSSFLTKRQPMSGRISAVMTMKEIEEMKKNAEREEKEIGQDINSVSGSSGTSSEFLKVSIENSRDVISMHDSSSISSGVENKKEKEDKKPNLEKEEEWEDIELHDIEESKNLGEKLNLEKNQSVSLSEVSSVTGSSVCEEHIMLNTGELLLSNGKL